VIVDVPQASIALAANTISKEKNKVLLVTAAATSDLTGKACTPNTIHWTYDTWAVANGTANAVVKTGGDTWFFVTADYAFGHALELWGALWPAPAPGQGHSASGRSGGRRNGGIARPFQIVSKL
jgi:hypothetical protein